MLYEVSQRLRAQRAAQEAAFLVNDGDEDVEATTARHSGHFSFQPWLAPWLEPLRVRNLLSKQGRQGVALRSAVCFMYGAGREWAVPWRLAGFPALAESGCSGLEAPSRTFLSFIPT